MTDQEINRAIQYVTAATSYDREAVALIIRTGLAELAALATTSDRAFDRKSLLEYVCRWTMAKTQFPEPQVREVLGSAARWLDELCDVILTPRTLPDDA
jgi:hypothetical protein